MMILSPYKRLFPCSGILLNQCLVPLSLPGLPISLKDAGELDSVVVEFCEKSTSLQSFNWPTFYEFIRLVWKKRLPLTSNEIWLLFEAHGASFKFKKFVVDFYQKGTELLIYVAGRKPIKKKRVQPLLAEN